MVTTSFISRLCRAVDLIEQRSQQNGPLKVVKVRRGFKEDPDAGGPHSVELAPPSGREYRDLQVLR